MNLFRAEINAAQWQKKVGPSLLQATALCNRFYIAWALVTSADDLHEVQTETARDVCIQLPDLTDMILAVPEPRSERLRTIRKDLVAALHLYMSSAEVAVGLCKWVVRGPGPITWLPSEGEARASIASIQQGLFAAAQRVRKSRIIGIART